MFIRFSNFKMLALGAVSLLIIGGCMRGPSAIKATYINADSAGQKAIEMYDANKDGKISGAEFDKAPALKQALPNFNSTLEKGVTAADISARIKSWQLSGVTRIMGVTCTVTRNGKPFVGGEVKFVPEKFLGDDLPVATGTTAPDGNALLSVPVTGKDDPPGVPPGFYRIEITKAGENIPAKYNTQTIYGEEVSDAPMETLKMEIK